MGMELEMMMMTKAMCLSTSNWEVNATFSICLFNHFSGNYRFSLGRAQRFHALKQEWGLKKFISKKDLTNPSNGYMFNDKCVFGAEVFVNENKAVTECMSLKNVEKVSYKKEIKISNFSRLKVKWVSKELKVGGYKCLFAKKSQVSPEGKGQASSEGKGVSSDYLRPPLIADEGAELETREASPAHFLIKIDSFSLLEKHGIQRLETREFKAGNYMWRLVIYPNGHGTGNDDKDDYVSVYLAITNKSALPSNWEVNATFSICLFNHTSDKYCYSLGRARRFHVLNQKWGFNKFISKKDLTDPLNGYMFNDKCVFGAEVFVNENKAVTECMLFRVDKDPYKQEFKISNFSTLKKEWISEYFTFGGHKWMIKAYPNGRGEQTGRSLSIFLCPVVVSVNAAGASSERVRLCCTIRVKDQSNDHKHCQHTFSDYWFSVSKRDGHGWDSIIKLSSLNDPNKGFIVKDSCVIEIELAVQAISS
ncbi:hypothetical protein CASFOL_012375 [Castilleja foliolosa]|uniref:MATH domain-containing protein n=1 Tax=Castilleja foliolosa TaxID=1961234 RepID=A0ABD3DL07_9LAMI